MDSNGASGSTPDPEAFLDRIVEFDGDHMERLEAMTDYRRDPGEARILYLCRRVSDNSGSATDTRVDEMFVMKVKVQVPPRSASDDPREPLPGPSAMTAAELTALRKFRSEGVDGVPHLVATKCSPQGTHGPFRGGYISYIVMTRMSGQDLMASKFWSLDDAVKEEIRHAFITLLKIVWRLGIAPYDCALRNIIWDSGTRRCSIVDFEHYQTAKDPINMTEREEMQRWGIVQRPPPSHWAIEWGLIKEPNAC